MISRDRIAAGLTALILGAFPMGGSVMAGDHAHFHLHSRPKSTQATPHTFLQAGNPQEMSRIARPSDNDHYSGDYVGGGKAFGGEGRCANEGTWGWDYTPFRPMSPRIFMNWSHGRRYQDGYGRYATDGPKPLEHITEAVHEHFGHE